MIALWSLLRYEAGFVSICFSAIEMYNVIIRKYVYTVIT